MDHPSERQNVPQKPSNSRPAGNCKLTIKGRNWFLLDSSQADLPIAGYVKVRQTGIWAGLFHINGRAGRDSQGGVIR